MKKKLIILISTISLLAGCSTTGNNEHSDAFNTENGSLFSVRNVQSGFMISNVLDQQGYELRGWQLIPQITPFEVLAQSPSGWVQFKDPGSDYCLVAQAGRSLSKSICNVKNKETLFILIPSTTGAVQIQSVASGTCIIDKEDSDNFKFSKCIADVRRPDLVIPEKNLWMLNPPVIASSIAPENI